MRMSTMSTIKTLLLLAIISSVTIAEGKPPLQCPTVCKCTNNFTIVNCDRKSLAEVPKDIPKSAVTLILSHNDFGEMQDDFFPTLPNLTALHLDVSKITGLEPHAFRGLPKLRQLFLFENQIRSIPENEFCQDIPMIEQVFLDRNALKALPNFSNCSKLATLTLENNQIHSFKFPSDYVKLTTLVRLTLSLNPVNIIRKDDFQSLSNSKVARLLLSRIGLEQVEEGAFVPIAKTLAALKISYNALNATQLQPIFRELSKCKALVSLDLGGLQFNSHLPPGMFTVFANSSLTNIDLANNEIATIESGTFSPLKKLIHLSLQGSKVGSIEPTAFLGLGVLRHLDLSRNSLSAIPSNLPPSLTDITMENNHITGIADNELAKLGALNSLNLHKNSIQQLREQAFGGLKKLKILDLSSNLIDHIPRQTLTPLRQLTKLVLKDNKLAKVIKNVHVFEQLKQLQELDLSENNCDTLPFTVFKNLTNLKTLNLSKNRLKYMLEKDKYGGMFEGLDNLVTLNLENNDIEHLSPVIFSHLTNVQTLLMSQNRIAHWDKELFTHTQKIRKLDLSHNKITVIDEHALGNNYSSFKTLNLEDNPFACTCELVWFCGWANRTKVKLIHYETNYTCSSPRSRQGVLLINFDWRSLVCFNYYPYIIAGSVLGGVILLTLIVVLLFRCRWRISLCCYRCGQRCPTSSDYQIVEDDKTFDAYLSFDKKDNPFVQEVIMNQFDRETSETNGKYQLCFEPRDFRLGSSIVKSMCHAVENSNRAIIVVTNAYLASGRFQMELDLLHNEYLYRSFGLIFVTTGPPLELKLLPKWLHKSYEDRKFLVWDENSSAQEEFRQRLDRKLRTPPPNRDESFQASV